MDPRIRTKMSRMPNTGLDDEWELWCCRDIDTHTHRVGRTGRAGVKGTAYTLVTTTDKEFAGHIVRWVSSRKHSEYNNIRYSFSLLANLKRQRIFSVSVPDPDWFCLPVRIRIGNADPDLGYRLGNLPKSKNKHDFQPLKMACTVYGSALILLFCPDLYWEYGSGSRIEEIDHNQQIYMISSLWKWLISGSSFILLSCPDPYWEFGSGSRITEIDQNQQ
jgi:hypothetical protein